MQACLEAAIAASRKLLILSSLQTFLTTLWTVLPKEERSKESYAKYIS
jgi:hypothetical protein